MATIYTYDKPTVHAASLKRQDKLVPVSQQSAVKANVDKSNQAPHMLNVNFKIRPLALA
jgi:hypothetical protein